MRLKVVVYPSREEYPEERYSIEVRLPEREVKVYRRGAEVPREEWRFEPVRFEEAAEGLLVKLEDLPCWEAPPSMAAWNDEVILCAPLEGIFRRRWRLRRRFSGGAYRHEVYVDGRLWFVKDFGEATDVPITTEVWAVKKEVSTAVGGVGGGTVGGLAAYLSTKRAEYGVAGAIIGGLVGAVLGWLLGA